MQLSLENDIASKQLQLVTLFLLLSPTSPPPLSLFYHTLSLLSLYPFSFISLLHSNAMLLQNELSTSTSKQIQTLTQKIEEQTQHAKRLAQEVDERKRAHADAAHENAEHAAHIRMLTEEKSLNIQTMKELMEENEELEADVAELRARMERMSEDTHARAEDAPVDRMGEDACARAGDAQASASVPAPPQPPAAPAPAQKVPKSKGGEG